MIAHDFVPHSMFAVRDACDWKGEVDGRSEHCGRRRAEHQNALSPVVGGAGQRVDSRRIGTPSAAEDQVAPGAGRHPEAIVADAAEAYLVAHLSFVKVRGQDPQTTADAASALANAWGDMNQAVAVRRGERRA